MGTTVSNLHVHVGDSRLDAEDVAAALSTAALVAPAAAGWVSVFVEEALPGDPATALGLSVQLGRPTVNFFCFDSDIAVAQLVSEGAVIDELVVQMPGAPDDLSMDVEMDTGDAMSGGEEVGSWQVLGSIDVWLATVGRDATSEELVSAVNRHRSDPFAEATAVAVLDVLGIPPARSLMAYRFFEQGEAPEDAATFLRVR